MQNVVSKSAWKLWANIFCDARAKLIFRRDFPWLISISNTFSSLFNGLFTCSNKISSVSRFVQMKLLLEYCRTELEQHHNSLLTKQTQLKSDSSIQKFRFKTFKTNSEPQPYLNQLYQSNRICCKKSEVLGKMILLVKVFSFLFLFLVYGSHGQLVNQLHH